MGGYSNKTRYSTEIGTQIPFICDNQIPENQEDLESAIIRDRLVDPDRHIEDLMRCLDEVGDYNLVKKYARQCLEDITYRPKSQKYNWSPGDNRANQNIDIEFIDDDLGGIGVKKHISSPNGKQLGKEDSLGYGKGENPFTNTEEYHRLWNNSVDKIVEAGHCEYRSTGQDKDKMYFIEVLKSPVRGTVIYFRIKTKSTTREKSFTVDDLKDMSNAKGDWRKMIGMFASDTLKGKDPVHVTISKELGQAVGQEVMPRLPGFIKKKRAELLLCVDKPYLFYTTKDRKLLKVPALDDPCWDNLSIEMVPGQGEPNFGSGVKYLYEVSRGDSTKPTTLEIHVRSNDGLFTNCMIGIQNLKDKESLWEALN